MIDVAFAIPELGSGGPDSVFRTLLRHLDRDRFRPSVIIGRGGARGDAQGSVVDEVHAGKYPVLSTHGVLRRRRPDVVLSTLRMNVTCAAVQPSSRRRGPVHVARIANNLTQQVRELAYVRSWPHLRAIEACYAFAVAHSHAVVAQTEVMRDDVEDRYGASVVAKTSVIHNPVDVDRLAERAAAPGASFDHDGPLLVSVGRLMPQKGYDLLVSALRDVVDEEPGAHLVLVGAGPDEAVLRERAARLGVTGHLTLLGRVDNPLPLVARADVFVSSSRYEGFSNALAEAQGLGVPAVAVGGAAAGDVIVTPESGVVVPTPEPTGLAAAVVGVLREAKSFDRAAIVQSTRERFDPAVITARYQDLWVATLEGHRPEPAPALR